jgi:hypothetical protein
MTRCANCSVLQLVLRTHEDFEREFALIEAARANMWKRCEDLYGPSPLTDEMTDVERRAFLEQVSEQNRLTNEWESSLIAAESSRLRKQ